MAYYLLKDLVGKDLHGKDFSGEAFDRVSFDGCVLDDCNFEQATFHSPNFDKVKSMKRVRLFGASGICKWPSPASLRWPKPRVRRRRARG